LPADAQIATLGPSSSPAGVYLLDVWKLAHFAEVLSGFLIHNVVGVDVRLHWRSEMVCSHCSREIGEYSNYCPVCGGRVGKTASHRRLMLSSTNSKIVGVCGGIAEYFNADPTIVRLIWAALSVVPGGFVGGILAYVFAWIIIPKGPEPGATLAGTPVAPTAKP
jgi:phage shock protein PspC (stress-responsive transcriptional regulator)